MASTIKMANGQFHIAFNEQYLRGERYAHMTLLHEQCHVATYDEIQDHGPKWQACMLRLDRMGAFRKEIIDGYEDDRR
jgi:predicted SprT family Zn-dependent metalloprotease